MCCCCYFVQLHWIPYKMRTRAHSVMQFRNLSFALPLSPYRSVSLLNFSSTPFSINSGADEQMKNEGILFFYSTLFCPLAFWLSSSAEDCGSIIDFITLTNSRRLFSTKKFQKTKRPTKKKRTARVLSLWNDCTARLTCVMRMRSFLIFRAFWSVVRVSFFVF